MNNKILNALIIILILVGISFAACTGTPPTCPGGYTLDPVSCTCVKVTGGSAPDIAKIVDALTALCSTVKNILGVGMMLMVVSAAVVYSVGQVMGAETRARASVWATSMFNGAIIAALIYLLVPFVLDKMLTGTGVTIPKCFILF